MHKENDFFLRDSEMSERLLAFDWSKTPVGDITAWPNTLRIATSICLNSRFPMMIWWGPELTFIYNDSYAPILGKKHPEALGKNCRAVWPELWPVIRSQIDKVLNEGKSTWNEKVHLIVERNGYPEDAWFTWSYSPIPDDAGGIGGLLNACTEDTEEILAIEEKSRLAEQRQLALDAAGMGWWHLNLKSGIVKWDKKFKNIFGILDDEGDYEAVLRFIHAKDRNRVMNAVSEALSPEASHRVSIECKILRQSEERWVWANGLATFSSDRKKEAIGFSGTVQDITKKKEQEEILQKSKDRLQQAIAISELGTFDIDIATDIVSVNEFGRKIYGWEKGKKLTFSYVQSFFYQEDKDAVMKEVLAAMDPRGHRQFDVVQRIIRVDGDVRWIRVRGKVIFEKGHGQEKPAQIIGTYIDITQNKQLEVQREEFLQAERAARSELEHVNRMKDEFLATLSHELRTPLNAILGWSQILQMKTPTPERLKTGLEAIEKNSLSQAQLIDDLLDMSRIISGKIHLKEENVHLQDLINSALESVMPTAEKKGIRLVKFLPADDAVISVDLRRFHQILWNLLSNAIKFTPTGGEVRIQVQSTDGQVQISIADTGQGIDPQFLPHVFERFRQADASITRSHGGLGLGLAIVRQLVNLHGGSIKAESAGAGKGATFTATIPVNLRWSAKGTPQHGSLESNLKNIEGAKIVVVDDHTDARLIVQQLLEMNNAYVIPARNGLEALGIIKAEVPDLLVCDIGMPEMDGYKLIEKVRELPGKAGHVPAIALTAFVRDEDRDKALDAGYQFHLKKPIEPAQLLIACSSLLATEHTAQRSATIFDSPLP